VTVFADSSALVKFYVLEDGSDAVRGLGEAIVVSELAGVEVPAALWRKQRQGEIDTRDAVSLSAAFNYDLRGGRESVRFGVVGFADAIVTEAQRLLPRYPLRGCDAVQVASAIHLRRVDAACQTVCAFDGALRTAAAGEGFRLIPA